MSQWRAKRRPRASDQDSEDPSQHEIVRKMTRTHLQLVEVMAVALHEIFEEVQFAWSTSCVTPLAEVGCHTKATSCCMYERTTERAMCCHMAPDFMLADYQ